MRRTAIGGRRFVAALARWTLVCLLGAIVAGCATPAPPERSTSTTGVGPSFVEGGPDAAEYGMQSGYPVGDRSTCASMVFLVGCSSHHDQVYRGRLVRRSATPSPLARAVSEPRLRYEYQGQSLTIDDYLARNPATGLLIARGTEILVERYQYARNDQHRLASWSMAKTVTAMLIGIAIAESRIRSVEDLAGMYLPELAGTEYGRTPLRHLLQMSSGVRFVEEYSGQDDVARLAFDTYELRGAGGVRAVSRYNSRGVPAGTRFSYASVETQVLGLVLGRAVGRPVAEYLEQKIWQPMGAEADATWLVDRAGQEATYCCLNAVLRDYARLALLLAHDGLWHDKQIVPATWIHDATTVRSDQPHLAPGVATRSAAYGPRGYGYQTWVLPGHRRMFMLTGLGGQVIFVDPQSRLALIHTAVRKRGDPRTLETLALWHAVARTLGGGTAALTGSRGEITNAPATALEGPGARPVGAASPRHERVDRRDVGVVERHARSAEPAGH